MTRTEFPKSVKRQAYERADGKCEGCGCQLTPANGGAEYDHILEDYLGGEATLENCRVLCGKTCHPAKTAESRPEIDRTRRLFEKHNGIRAAKKSTFSGARDGNVKVHMNGKVTCRKTGKVLKEAR